MLRAGIVYLVTNLVNGKKYVGQTVQNVKTRWSCHKSDAKRGSDQALHKAIRKYGPENFSIEVVADSYSPFLDEVEKLAIWTYQSHVKNNGYNVTAGGSGMQLGRSTSAETRAKLSLANKGKEKHFKKGHTPWNKGGTHSEESCKKMSKSRTGMGGHWTGKKRLGHSSKYLGVSYFAPIDKWICRFKFKGKRIYLGYSNTEIAAAERHDEYVMANNMDRPLNFSVAQMAA